MSHKTHPIVAGRGSDQSDPPGDRLPEGRGTMTCFQPTLQNSLLGVPEASYDLMELALGLSPEPETSFDRLRPSPGGKINPQKGQGGQANYRQCNRYFHHCSPPFRPEPPFKGGRLFFFILRVLQILYIIS